MQRINLKKELKEYYTQHKNKVSIIKVPEFKYLVIEGRGVPYHSPEFMQSLENITNVSLSLKFMVKNGELQIDYGLMPIECTWKFDSSEYFSVTERDNSSWALMVLQPDVISDEMLMNAIDEVKLKKDPEGIDKIKSVTMSDGLSVQALHIGPFDSADSSIEKLNSVIEPEGFKLAGFHREIYINDYRKVTSDLLKTIIRHRIIKI